MTTLVLESDPIATKATIRDDSLIVELADGRSLTVPLAWYPRLVNASDAERRNCLLLGNGYAIEWPDLDEHIGIEGLLAGRRSAEKKKSLARWSASRGKPERRRKTTRKGKNNHRRTGKTGRLKPKRA